MKKKACNIKFFQPKFIEENTLVVYLKTNKMQFRFEAFLNKKKSVKYVWEEFLPSTTHYILI